MSYAASAVSYWVGQANDFSTGPHPTGWTSGQRWSETAEEWRLMAINASGTAIDTSTGRHPVGWSSGQYWSETAAEWMAMYDTEFANARDTSAGQPNKPSGVAHPGGWVSNQFWSATATQWNTMWGTEWNAARDPQGVYHSYPGQAANAVYWSSSASYWRGQADYYWGPNRVWNNGGTWEGQANHYWGPSRVWNNGQTWEYIAGYNGWVGRTYQNGERWEDAYNRVYTDRYNAGYSAGAGSKSCSAVGGGFSGSSNNQDMCGLYAPRTGLAHVSAIATFHLNEGGPDAHFHFFRNGGQVLNGRNCAGSWDGVIAADGNIQVNQGDYITVRGQGDQGASWHSGYMLMTVGSQ